MLRPDRLNPLFAPVTALGGVGPALAKSLARLFEREDPRVLDLVFHLPTSIVDRSLRTTVAGAPVGAIATLTLTVEGHKRAPPGRRGVPHRVVTSDGTGDVVLVFFGGEAGWIERKLPIGETRLVSGTIESFDGVKQIVHPDHVVPVEHADRMPTIEPVYPLTEGLSPRLLSRAIAGAVERVPALPEWIDPQLVAERRWPDFRASLTALHHPEGPEALLAEAPAPSRLAYDELFAGQVALGLVRGEQKRAAGRASIGDGRLIGRLSDALPWPLTGAQRRSIDEIDADMASPDRMIRLLQGDVGSGKTIVALFAMARAVEAGRQAALMAPTEILARQHAATIAPLAERVGITTAILTGREKGRERAELLARLAAGSIDVLIGTHAVFQDGVAFRDLGLAVVDEQHRFGVAQRLALAEKGAAADLLVMTATPIPRTLVLTFYGDMDVSRLDEKPPGRKPIDTRAVPMERLDEVVAGVGRAIERGDRVYWICPLVSESEDLDVTAVEERHAALSAVFPGRVGLLHGRMKGPAKDAALSAFQRGETAVLVATTVVEVGVDVPEASIIVIEHASASASRSFISCAAASGAASDRPPACCSTAGRSARSRASACRSSATARTVSPSRKPTSDCVAPARCWARASPACRRPGWCAGRRMARSSRSPATTPVSCSRATPICRARAVRPCASRSTCSAGSKRCA